MPSCALFRFGRNGFVDVILIIYLDDFSSGRRTAGYYAQTRIFVTLKLNKHGSNRMEEYFVANKGENLRETRQRYLVTLLLLLLRFMRLKDFRRVLWDRPSRCIIKENQDIHGTVPGLGSKL